jgi:hypothetical protein
MRDFEKLGLFYLGRGYDLDARKPTDDLVLYESRDLVTHAVCVGMTGSGKTGLCLSLIEEAAIDGVPVLAIDPKGDLGDLLLTFPSLSPEAFRPWVDEDEARRNGQAVDAFAAAEAERWKKGLADWGQDGARIERLRQAAEFAIYTPGSRAGLPVSILSSFAAPPPAARTDAEAMAERAAATATSVLALAGVDVGPRSREHTLLSTLFSEAWSQGRDLDLPALIQHVQSPPFVSVGVVDLEAFFPAKDRFDLAMQLNGLLAAPGFAQWLEGAPLDPKSLLYTADGKPRVAIFSIAHLGDAERMFFVSLLLNQVVAWMRAQTGTSSLRAIVYMDEIAGYFPPVANPPSKAPLLTLLKQARAFGIGVVLATQNPVDLDYKALGNTGTWFLGRLQTDRDKARLLDGLESAAGSMDRATADRLLSSLDKRVFLLHDVHARAPLAFQTRWTMSYLRGPLSRDQISTLMAGKVAAPGLGPRDSGLGVRDTSAGKQGNASPITKDAAPPVLPPGVQQFFVPAPSEPRTSSPGSRTPSPGSRTPSPGTVHYTPVVLGAARVGFGDTKLGIDEVRDVVYAVPFASGAVAIDWASAQKVDIPINDLQSAPGTGATFGAVPSPGLQAKNYTAWSKDFTQWIVRSEKLELLRQRDMKLTSNAGETEGEFKVRVQEAQRAARDAAVDDIKKKYEAKAAQLQAQRERAQAAVERESAQATQQKIQTGLSVGAAVLGALFGRKTITVGSLGRATTAARGVGKTMKESDDIRRANENVGTIRERERALQDQIESESAKITETFAKAPEIERLGLAPKRGQVSVQLLGLGWIPDR